jgi:hypothetical protein
MRVYKGLVNEIEFIVRASSARVAINRMIEDYEVCEDLFPNGGWPLERKNARYRRLKDLENRLQACILESGPLK